MFCWFPPGGDAKDMPEATRAKLAHVGRPEPSADGLDAPQPAFDLGVFENLHWDRYDGRGPRRVPAGLLAVAAPCPRARILVGSHPAGAWADGLSHELAQFGNITAPAAVDARRGMADAAEILRGIKRVITTPSTVALDAALTDRPMALAVDGGGSILPCLY